MVLVPVIPVIKKGEAGPPIANILVQKLHEKKREQAHNRMTA